MSTILLLVALTQVPAGPLDGFQANYASIKTELDFDYTEGRLGAPTGSLSKGQTPNYIPDGEMRILGRWACDGDAEYFLFSSPDDVLAQARKDRLKREQGKVYYHVQFVPKTELIWDGELTCSHSESPHYRGLGVDPSWKTVSAQLVDRELGALDYGRGPFLWGFCAFPHILKLFEDSAPSHYSTLRWGYPTEVEVYRKQSAGERDWEQIEISYDPSIGYLPRFFRCLSYGSANNSATVREIYLTEARPCLAGGFVPTEWHQLAFIINSFDSRFANYNHETRFDPRPSEIGASRFRASNLRKLSGPVALEELESVHSIAGIGGAIIRPKTAKPLSLQRIRTIMGDRLTMPQSRLMPRIDVAELRELEKLSTSSQIPYILAGVAILVLAILLLPLLIRKGKTWITSILLATLIGFSGCGLARKPFVKVTGAYKTSVVYIEPSDHELDLELILRNDGNQHVRIQAVDGGCTCRKVDQSHLPIVLKPGAVTSIRVKQKVTPVTMPQHSEFSIGTDQGALSIDVPFRRSAGINSPAVSYHPV